MKRGQVPNRLPKTGQQTEYVSGDDGTFKAGQSIPATRFEDLGNGMVFDAHTNLTWCKAPRLIIPGGGVGALPAILVTGCVRDVWALDTEITGWTTGATTRLTFTSVVGLQLGTRVHVIVYTTEHGTIEFGVVTILAITGPLVTVDFNSESPIDYSGDEFLGGTATNVYQAGELVDDGVGQFWVAKNTHTATTTPSQDQTNWGPNPFISAAVYPFTITAKTLAWQAALEAIAYTGTWNGIACGAGAAGNWRMPNINEENSLWDMGNASSPFIFTASGVVRLADKYWTSTTNIGNTLQAYGSRYDLAYFSPTVYTKLSDLRHIGMVRTGRP